MVKAFVFGNAIVYDDFLVHNSDKEPVVYVVDGDNDLILFVDFFMVEGFFDLLLWFGYGDFCKKRVEYFVPLTDFGRLVVNHFEVRINNLVVKPGAKRKGHEGLCKEIFRSIKFHALNQVAWVRFPKVP